MISLFWRPKKPWFLFLLAIVLHGCGAQMPSIPSPLKPMGENEDVKIGREFRREAKKHFKFVNNPEVDRYVERIGRRITSAMGPQMYDYRYFVINEDVLNAFAVPGGSIYIYAGLLDRVKSTDELAAVVAHEIIHTAKRHMARMSGPDPVALLGLLGAILAAQSGAGAQAAAAVGQGIAATRQIAYTRQLETEADTLGLKYMSSAGYDPRAMVSFQKTMLQEQTLNPIDVPPYLLDHPLTQDRIANAELMIRSLNAEPSRFRQLDPLKRIQTIVRLDERQAEALASEQEKLLGENPEDAQARHLLGIIRQYQGRWDEARENYEQARELDPESPGIDRDLGRLYTQIGKFSLAHEAFERSLKTDSREPLNYLFLGELFEKESNFPEAVAAYRRAQNLAPLWPEPPRRLGVVYGKMDRLADAYTYLGRAYFLDDEDEQAIANFRRAVKILGPDSPHGQIIKEELDAITARN